MIKFEKVSTTKLKKPNLLTNKFLHYEKIRIKSDGKSGGWRY